MWVDGQAVGKNNSLVAPHEYDISKFISPGKHFISICVDNRIKDINVGPDSHSITDHTQGNWNGIIGKIRIEADPLVSFRDIQIYSDVKK